MATIDVLMKHGFKLYLSIAIGLWLVGMSFLLITDVWDESNILMGFEQMRNQFGYSHTLAMIWTQELGGIYRPIPLSIGLIVSQALKNYYLTWLALRLLNVAFLLGSLFFLVKSVRVSVGENLFRDAGIILLFLCSGSIIISASWFANIFDASVLFFLAFGLYAVLGSFLFQAIQ